MRLRRLLVRVPLALLAALLLGSAVFIAWNWTYVAAFPAILPAFYAKEYCSCRYVMRQEPGYCHVYARQWLPISRFAEDEAARQVTVTALGVTRGASWLAEREGCRLEP